MELYPISDVAKSCLYTAAQTVLHDKRQCNPAIPAYTIPDGPTRLLRAKLILEEAVETINALGFHVSITITAKTIDPTLRSGIAGSFIPVDEGPNLIDIIDGCCDTIYVATGCLMSMGVPDLPHLQAVCNANDAKFKDGAIVDKNGKYLKPKDWQPPTHENIMAALLKEQKHGTSVRNDEG